MTVEYIRYTIAADAAPAFEAAYATAAESLAASPHCSAWELSRCVEDETSYILRIEWDSVDGHLQGFRKEPEFGPFLAAIRPYIDRIDEMRHYEATRVASG